MKKAIIVSQECIAGMNVKTRLLELFEFKEDGVFEESTVYSFKDIKLYTIKEIHIFREDLDKEIDADLFVFATTHRSKAGIPSLCVHAPGNWDKAELGGRDKQLCISMPGYMKIAYNKLIELNTIEFDIVQEATHHGPYMEKPIMFIEIGSSEKEWVIKEAGEIIANTIIHILTEDIPKHEIAFGIGGQHTTTNFKKIVENTNIAIGHVCPKYMLERLDKNMVQQALDRNMGKVDHVILDWKGLGKEKKRISDLLKELNIEFKRTKDY
jgi:D-aminoacyl-tRNA deacylase|tara:strand:+ start:223 stop:1026 length:804 start_codon:yes stop_codon:yes gene_type:complete